MHNNVSAERKDKDDQQSGKHGADAPKNIARIACPVHRYFRGFQYSI
jgi:hypothetical protein